MGLDGLVVVFREDGPGSRVNPTTLFENGVPAASFLTNRNGFRLDKHGVLTSGPAAGKYILLPKPPPAVKGEFPSGTPSITAPQYADPKNKADYAPGRAGKGYVAGGTIRVHSESADGSPDSTGCLTCAAKDTAAVKGLMDRNLNNGGTTIIFVDGKQTLNGKSVLRAEPVLHKESQ